MARSLADATDATQEPSKHEPPFTGRLRGNGEKTLGGVHAVSSPCRRNPGTRSLEASCGRAPLDARHVLCASTVADAARHASKAHGARSAGSPSAPAHTRRDAMFGAMFGTTRRRLRLASDMRPARLGSATPLGLLGSASSWPPCRLEQALVRMLSSSFCLRSPWWALHAPQAARRSAQQLACRGRRGRASCRASWAGLRRRGACCGGS